MARHYHYWQVLAVERRIGCVLVCECGREVRVHVRGSRLITDWLIPSGETVMPREGKMAARIAEQVISRGR
jgi:hypothetical protein